MDLDFFDFCTGIFFEYSSDFHRIYRKLDALCVTNQTSLFIVRLAFVIF